MPLVNGKIASFFLYRDQEFLRAAGDWVAVALIRSIWLMKLYFRWILSNLSRIIIFVSSSVYGN